MNNLPTPPTPALYPLTPPRAPAARAGPGRFVDGDYRSRYGRRGYKLYLPGDYRGQPVPLLVMLHGCGQDPDDFAAGTRLNALAERETWLAVYPGQNGSANQFQCWNWFEPANQARGRGEPALIAGITQQVMGQYAVDSARVYVAGFSAGGAMAVILGAAYPDLYAAIGVHSGLEYRAAHDLRSALQAQSSGGPDPDRQGALAYQAGGPLARPVPVIVFHGDADTTVDVVNGHQVIAQWAQTNDLADDGADNDSVSGRAAEIAEGRAPGGDRYTRSIYTDRSGAPLMEKWIVHGLGHAWSGGSPGGSFADPRGPDASAELLRFFKAHSLMR